MRRAALVVALMVFNGPAHAWWWGPSSPESCVSSYANGATNEQVAKWTTQLCYAYFAQGNKEQKYQECAIQELSNINNEIAGKIALQQCAKLRISSPTLGTGLFDDLLPDRPRPQ